MRRHKIMLLASTLLFSVVAHAGTPRAPEPASGNPILNKDGSRAYMPCTYPNEPSAPDRVMGSAGFRRILCTSHGARDVTGEGTVTLSEHTSGGVICERELSNEEARDMEEAMKRKKSG